MIMILMAQEWINGAEVLISIGSFNHAQEWINCVLKGWGSQRCELNAIEETQIGWLGNAHSLFKSSLSVLTLFVGAELTFKFETNYLKSSNEWQTIWNEMNLLCVKEMSKSKVWINCVGMGGKKLG